MTTTEIDLNFEIAEEVMSRILKSWKDKQFTREQMLVAWIKGRYLFPNGPAMEAFCAVVMAQRIIEHE